MSIAHEAIHAACATRALQALGSSVQAGDTEALRMLAERHLVDVAVDENASYEITIRGRTAEVRVR